MEVFERKSLEKKSEGILNFAGIAEEFIKELEDEFLQESPGKFLNPKESTEKFLGKIMDDFQEEFMEEFLFIILNTILRF